MSYTTNLVKSVLHATEGVLRATEIVEIRRYGLHTMMVHRDGRISALTKQRWDSEDTIGPTPFELLQLGLEMTPCAPEVDEEYQVESFERRVAVLESTMEALRSTRCR